MSADNTADISTVAGTTVLLPKTSITAA